MSLCSTLRESDNKNRFATVLRPWQVVERRRGHSRIMTSLGFITIVLSAVAVALAFYAMSVRRQLARASEEAELQSARPAPVARTAEPTFAPPPVDRRDALFRALVDNVQDAVVVHRDHIVFANAAFSRLVGRPTDELVGRSLSEFVSPEYAGLVESNLARRIAGEQAPGVCEIEIADVYGQVTRLELNGVDVDIGGQRTVLYTAIEMLPRAQGIPAAAASVPAAPAEASPRAQRTLDAMADGLVATDADGRIEYLNRAAEQMAGVTVAEARGLALGELFNFVDETDRKPLPDPARQCLTNGTRVNLGRRAVMTARRTATEFGIEATAAPIQDDGGAMTGVVVTLHDVSELRGLTRQMSYQASHDALTGLVNRREFERRIADALESLREGGASHMLCFLDLDRFKNVNDTCGHMAGDSMLRELAALIRDAVRDSDIVARLGGDEFGLLLPGCPLDKARQIADDVCGAVADYRFVWRDRIFTVGVSVGLVEVGRDSGSVEEVLTAADSACYAAKNQSGGRVHVYSSRDEVLARHRGEIHWLQRLQTALRDGRFELYVQRIVPMQEDDGSGLGLEIFVRLTDDAGNAVAPAEFMAAAERYRLMSLVDRWVVQAAFTALGSGSLQLAEGRCMSINLSGQSLGDPTFLEFVVDTLDRTGVQPAQVCFEVSESTVSTNIEHAQRFIGVLHGMGCQFALDNFGTDLGAFANLKNLSMDYLKIDGSYMNNLGRDTVNQAMVAAMIRLARTLSFRVVAEQVEDPASLEAARSMGVDFAQGFAISRPSPLKDAA